MSQVEISEAQSDLRRLVARARAGEDVDEGSRSRVFESDQPLTHGHSRRAVSGRSLDNDCR